MFMNINKSQLSFSALAAPANKPCSMHLGSCVAVFSLLAACTSVTSRLNANFNTDTLGALPASAPAPTPPADLVVWRTASVISTVATRSGQDRWVRVVPQQGFIASPDSRQVFLIATTEGFTTSPPANVRGSLRLRLSGLGTVGVGVRLLQAGRPLDFIGGIQLSNFLSPTASQVDALAMFSGTQLTDSVGPASIGKISGYANGDVIDINWTLDQPSRTFSASVLGGPQRSNTFPAIMSGLATTPVQQLMFFVWLEHPTATTTVFIDNLSAEEFK